MTNLYVRSTDGSDADNGTTWALAKATIGGASGASTVESAGDIIWLSQVHNESTSSSTNAWAGTASNPNRILCGNDGTEPPTAVTTGATVTVSGTTFSWSGTTYCYGVAFVFTSVSSYSPNFNATGNHWETFEKCDFFYTGAAGSSGLAFGGTSAGVHSFTELRDCRFKLGGSSQLINIYKPTRIIGGSWASGGTSPTSVFTVGTSSIRPAYLIVENFDFTNLGSASNLISSVEGGSQVTFRYCKLPASWTGSLMATSAQKLGTRVSMYNCDNAATNYRLWIEDYGGSIKHETTIVKSSGATDGTTALSWKMATSANVAFPASILYSDEIHKWNETTGSSVTATVDIVHDAQGAGTAGALQDDEIWLEAMYISSSGTPLGGWVRDMKSDVVAAATDQTSSSATWSGTGGFGSAKKQQLSVTFTPQQKGFIICRVAIAKASKTIYVDPLVTLS